MKRTMIKWLRMLCLALFSIIAIAFSMLFVEDKNSFLGIQTITVDAQVSVEDCHYGAQKTFDSKTTVLYNGQEFVADNGVLIYPDETTFIIKDNAFLLNQIGCYTLRYFYEGDTFSLIAEKEFEIYNNLYSVSDSEKTSIYEATREEQMGETLNSINDNITVTKEDALIVRLEDGSKFSYSKPIDLSESKEDGLASIIRLDPKLFYFDEVTSGGYAFEHWIADGLKIRLTDCYDANIYIEVTITTQMSSTKPPLYTYDFPYVRASTNTLPNAGLQVPSTATVNAAYSKEAFVDGERGLLFMSTYGTGSSYRWLNKSTNGIEILFDNQNARLYCRSIVSGEETTKIVTDFNNSAYGNLKYQPFTTGEVYLSMECCDYQVADAARVDIFSIGNDGGEYLVSEDNYLYRDNKKPIINVDFDATKNDFGYVAVGEYYNIPAAESVDVNLLGSVDVVVYKNYESAYRTIVTVEDGKFMVADADVYTIEYSASDKYGNIQTETVKVYGVKQPDGKKTVNVNIGEKFTSFNAGEEYILPKPIISTLNDANKLHLQINISCPGKQSETLVDVWGKEELDDFFEKGCVFVPLYAGEYTISYRFADNMMDYSANGIEYSVMSNVSEVVNFIEKPFLERYLLKDAEYSFEKINAYRYSTGEPVVEDNVTAYIRFDGASTYTEIADLNRVKITGTSTAQLKFACGDVFVESDIATIIDVNYAESRKIKIDKYFVQDDFELVDGASLVFKSKKTSGDASISFANRIGYQNLSFKFMLESGYSDYKKLNIILTEPTDLNKKAVISFYNDSKDNFVVSVNNGKEYMLNDTFSSSVEKMVGYNATSKILTIANCENVIWADFGFTSSTVYLDIECVGLNGKGGIRINSINNQNIGTNVKRDNKSPEFYDANPSRGTYAKDSIVNIYPVIYYDVLSPILNDTISVKVTDAQGNYLKSIDGILLDGIQNDPNAVYAVKFTDFGEYYVDYASSDLQGNDCTTRTFIVIKDCEKPVLTLIGEISEGKTVNVAKGEELLISYTLTDDTSDSDQLDCYITVLDLKTHYIYAYNETNHISFSYQGNFEITLTARDAAGNYTTKSFFVIVN